MHEREIKRKNREPKIYYLADKSTEILIYFIILFSPWAFGTTESWSIWITNISSYILGSLLVVKLFYKKTKSFYKNKSSHKENSSKLTQKIFIQLLMFSMLVLLSYILLSAINARATFNLETKEYIYFEKFNKNLPHSYNSQGTWFVFWQYLGLICLFWSTKEWLFGAGDTQPTILLNQRFKKLLFLICFNGGILAMECILQRIYYSEYNGKLLFLVEPELNKNNITNFGSFAYRSNAATYLNLVWPLGLGLLIQLGRENLDYGKRRIGNGSELLLIPFIILIASGPIISSSRGGAFVMIGMLIIISLGMLFIKIQSKFLRMSVALILFTGLGAAYYQGWEKLEPRLTEIFSDNMSNRIQIYEVIGEMIKDYSIFGSGPGSFEAIIQFELDDKFQIWQSWAHNDYLEFYLTFGKLGGLIILLFLASLIIHLLISVKYRAIRAIRLFGILSLLGMAIHAILDFPLQVQSILLLATIISASLLGPIRTSVR